MDNSVILTITILLLVIILFILTAINAKRIPDTKKKKVFKKLEQLEEQANSEEVYARRDAYIKLDNLLNRALQIKYNNDLSCGENLKSAKSLFTKQMYQDVWDVHKIRNEIVHNDEDVSLDETKKAYHIYKLCINRILK